MEPSRAFFLSPCSSSKSSTTETPQEIAAAAAAVAEEDGGDPNITTNPRGNQKEEEEAVAPRRLIFKKKKRGVIILKPKRVSLSSTSFSSTTTASSSYRNRGKRGGTPRRGGGTPRRGGGGGKGDDDGGLQDLALPLGMSFAAIVAQVLKGINGSRDQIPVDRLSLICTSAVKKSLENIYGNRFDCFLLNFEKSFDSTFKTLQLINEASVAGHRNRTTQVPIDEQGNRKVSEPSNVEQGNINLSLFPSSSGGEVSQGNHELFNDAVEKSEVIPSLTTVSNQIVLHGQMNQQLASASHSFAGAGFSQSILSTFERSVMEQTRSNDLKAFEIGLIGRKLQLKESQLALSSYANMLEKIKVSMGISKASFKEEKLRNQMLDTRHAEFLRRCIDLLVSGLIVMSGCLGYGTYIFSYQRIMDATLSCSDIPKESKSWWIPNPMASFNSGWYMLRCHVVALTRMFFGLAMIVAIAYSVFQRSAMSTPTTMPVTFILLLGFLCGIAGKLCVDTLGGSGFHWLLYWESLCLLHFFANVFPSVLYHILYGPISVSQIKGGRLAPYWLKRFMFNFILSILCPALCGLLPFASLGDWKEHFTEKMNHLIIGVPK